MWSNRITLDFIKHNAARVKIGIELAKRGFTDECIADLHISTDSGYVYYEVTLGDKSSFTVFDDGSTIK